MYNRQAIINDLIRLGIQRGDTLLVHSSYKAIGSSTLSPKEIIECLLECVGDAGTLLMPALSYKQEPKNEHDNRSSPSNVGVIPESFRVDFDSKRSLHPTHSVCAIGELADELLANHSLDRTPCGVHSPFRKLLFMDAKILMLGCGLLPNTTMHAIEEIIGTPYLFGDEESYRITNSNGDVQSVLYRNHGFDGWQQQYDRVTEYIDPNGVCVGQVGDAKSYLLSTEKLLTSALSVLKSDRYAFVSPKAS